MSLVLAVVLVAVVGYAVARTKRDFVDFEVYRTAGVRALAAESLYRPDDGHYQFKYWPAFALAMTPFALVHPEVGTVVWYALSVALLAVFLKGSIALVPNRRSTERFLTVWVLLLTAKFIVKELVNGQTNALLGMLIILALVAAERQRPMTAGALIGLATFIKPYALLFAPWLVATLGVTTIAGGAVVLIGGLLLPATVYGWQGNLTLLERWYATVVETTPANLLFPENISFAAMWAKWMGAVPVASALAVGTAAAALATAGLIVWRRAHVARPGFLEVGFLLLLVPLLSPQGWDYLLLIAAPAIALLVDRFRERTRSWQAVTAVGFVLTSFTIFDLLGRQLYLSLMAASVVSVGALLLAASLVQLRLAGRA